MSGAETSGVWGQELEVHWPQSWRFVTGRDVLLEIFAPQVFTVTDSTIFLRYGENRDLRISENGLHFRILTLDNVDEQISDVFEKVLRVIEPTRLNGFEASFAHVFPIESEYDEARQVLPKVFYGPWIQERSLEDFALLWDERPSPEEEAQFELGVVNSREVILRVARAVGISPDVLRQQMPAWMKVRMPKVAIFMKSGYASTMDISPDLASTRVPQVWHEWRERSSQLFGTLTNMAALAQKGE